jgi:hypothetical protein
MPTTAFHPQVHGFHFDNRFDNHVIGNLETHGLCGGMAFASLDYYYAGMPIPTHQPEDFPDGKTPAEGSRLRNFIYKRMMNSVERNAAQWLNVLANPVFSAKRFTKRHLDDLRAEIDAGRPAPLGLIGTTKIIGGAAGNHQVVCYGYNLSADGKSITFLIYDNNFHDTEVTLTTNPDSPESITYSHGSGWIAFFLSKYKTERPEYFDLALSQGIQLELHGPVQEIDGAVARQHRVDDDGRPLPPTHATAQFQECGQAMAAHFSVHNYGDYPARLTRLVMKMRDPSGDETFFAANEVTTIAPGSESGAGKSVGAFPNEPGGYDLRAEFVNTKGKPIRIPARGPGTDNDVQFSAVPVGTTLRKVPLPVLAHA